MRQFVLAVFFVVHVFWSYGQGQDRPIYFFKDRYSEDLQRGVLKKFDNVKIIGASSIYRSHSSPIDLSRYEKRLLELIPDDGDSSLLCIDIENFQYNQLKRGTDREIKSATEAFISVLKLTKTLRPNLKIGLYAVPFNFYYDSQNRINKGRKFDSILEYVDVLFPSLYVYYPAKQKGQESNFVYFKKNLDVTFELSMKYNKKVYPFFWYLVHPSNKRFGYSLLTKEEVDQYLEYIMNYNYQGRRVSGIIWWDTITPYNKRLIKGNKSTMEEVLLSYFIQ